MRIIICDDDLIVVGKMQKYLKSYFNHLHLKCPEIRLFRGNGGLKTATTPVFIHAKRHSVFDLEVECVYQSIQGTPYRAYFVCF